MDFRTMFEPKTMAVVGLSLSNERHPANIIYNKNFFRYPVKVFGVNPKGGMYHKEKVYRSISEIPEKIDLAIIAVRAEHVPGVLRECRELGRRRGRDIGRVRRDGQERSEAAVRGDRRQG